MAERLEIVQVDDAKMVGVLISNYLRPEGHSVHSYTDPIQAFAEVERRLNLVPPQIDLVITDRTMPGMNGIELARKIRGLKQDIPILLLTAQVLIPEGEAKEVDAIVGKPVRPQPLKDGITAAVFNAQQR